MGQIDEISSAIGRLTQAMEDTKKYMHDKEHDNANHMQAILGRLDMLSREIASLEKTHSVKLATEFAKLEVRIIALENAQLERKAVQGFLMRIVQIPGVAWLFGVGMVVAAFLIGRFK